MSDLDKFLEKRGKILIPSGDVARIKLLAKELIMGVHRNLWSSTISTMPSDTDGNEVAPVDRNLANYLEKRWGIVIYVIVWNFFEVMDMLTIIR